MNNQSQSNSTETSNLTQLVLAKFHFNKCIRIFFSIFFYFLSLIRYDTNSNSQFKILKNKNINQFQFNGLFMKIYFLISVGC